MNNKFAGWLRHNLATALTALVSAAVVLWVIGTNEWDPLALARLGTIYSDGVSDGTQGYDGQFVYYIARDLSPETVAPHLDEPAYRYQRILLPLLAWGFSWGGGSLLPWVLPGLTIFSHVLGTWAVAELLRRMGISQVYALVYGLWVGLLLGIRLDLPEPLAYGLVAWALLSTSQGHRKRTWLFYALALFAKEVTAVFLVAHLFSEAWNRRWRNAFLMSLTTLLPFAIFQAWLWWVFGEPGIGSGGAMATPFEFIPFMGLWRIGAYSLGLMAATLVVFGPAVILPSLWGLWAGGRAWLAGKTDPLTAGLVLNCLLIPTIPFSTFREPGGLLRFVCGLVLVVVLFAAREKKYRVLNYTFLWIIFLIFLIKN